MIVSSDKSADIVWTYGIGNIIPIVHIPILHRIMGDQDYRLIFSNFIHFLFHPCDVLRYYMPVGHTHQWS